MSDGIKPQVPGGRFVAIATDVQFWIPLAVLLGGFFLLDKLR